MGRPHTNAGIFRAGDIDGAGMGEKTVSFGSTTPTTVKTMPPFELTQFIIKT